MPLRKYYLSPQFLTAIGSLLLLCALLLGIPYTFGVGTFRVSLGTVLWSGWMANEDMEHALFVFPIVAFLLWQCRMSLAEIPVRASKLGAAVLLFGLFFYYAGYRGDVFTIGEIGFLFSFYGAVLWLWGWAVFRLLLFPLAILLFAFPIPGIDAFVTFPLRIIMSHASYYFLNGIGLDVVRSGTGILSAPDPMLGIPAGKKFAVDVADPCSGIRSLFALMMVSALYAHFTLQTAWKKWVLFLCSIPLAILGNLARIIMLTLGMIAFGSEFALGKNPLTDPSWFHSAAGYLVFLVALGGMAGISWLLTNVTLSSLHAHLSTLLHPKRLPSPPTSAETGPETGRKKKKKEDAY